MSIFNSSKSKKKKSSSDQKVKYFSDYSKEKNTSEKPIPAPASSSTTLSSSLTGSSQFGDMSISEIGGIDPGGELTQDLQESITRSRQINTEAFEVEDVEVENTSQIYNNYNSEVDIKRIVQSEGIKELYNRLSLNFDTKTSENNILLLSHENYKITNVLQNIHSGAKTFMSNGTYINPEQLNILKTSYYEGKLNNISKRFFFNNKNEKNHQELYINKIKTNNSKKSDYLNSFDEFTNLSKAFTENQNFANQLIEYSKSGKNKNYFGKILNILYKDRHQTIEISNFKNHKDDSFALVENISEPDLRLSFKDIHLEYILKNYYKLEFNDQTNNLNNFFTNSNLIDSDGLIAKKLFKLFV